MKTVLKWVFSVPLGMLTGMTLLWVVFWFFGWPLDWVKSNLYPYNYDSQGFPGFLYKALEVVMVIVGISFYNDLYEVLIEGKAQR